MTSSKKIVGYNVYHMPEGGSPSFYGRVKTISDAKKLASKGRRLEESLWDTASASGHCGGLSAPDQAREADEPTHWFGGDGYDCAIPVFGDDVEELGIVDMSMPVLYRYSDKTQIRNATEEELRQSIHAAERDGGAGVITVDGVDCYVEE